MRGESSLTPCVYRILICSSCSLSFCDGIETDILRALLTLFFWLADVPNVENWCTAVSIEGRNFLSSSTESKLLIPVTFNVISPFTQIDSISPQTVRNTSVLQYEPNVGARMTSVCYNTSEWPLLLHLSLLSQLATAPNDANHRFLTLLAQLSFFCFISVSDPIRR